MATSANNLPHLWDLFGILVLFLHVTVVSLFSYKVFYFYVMHFVHLFFHRF